jgi:tetratricopeptide (TPR) repeat protein
VSAAKHEPHAFCLLGSAALGKTNFSFCYGQAQSSDMRLNFGILAIVMIAGGTFAADVRDLGVPAGWKASDYDRHGYDLLNKLDYENARRYFDAAIRTDPYMWIAYFNRPTAFIRQKKWSEALQDLNSTIRLRPSFFEATSYRAGVNERLGNYRASLNDLDSLVRLTSSVRNRVDQAVALNSRAWLRATCPDASMRNGQLAIADAKRACELTKWKWAWQIDTLAAAYAEAGDFDSAIRYQEQAISTAGNAPQEVFESAGRLFSKRNAMELAKKEEKEVEPRRQKFSKHLEFYKQHRPYRETPQ